MRKVFDAGRYFMWGGGGGVGAGNLEFLICCNFYAPEAHIMYLTVSSSFLISFV